MYGNRHRLNIGYKSYVKDGDTIVQLSSTNQGKHINTMLAELQQSATINETYIIPPKLIEHIFTCISL